MFIDSDLAASASATRRAYTLPIPVVIRPHFPRRSALMRSPRIWSFPAGDATPGWMPAPRACCLALALLAGLAACAARETRATRDAFKSAVTKGRAPGDPTPKDRDPTRNDATPGDTSAWKALFSFTNAAAEMLSLGTSTATLPTLIKKLCAEPPEDAKTATAVRCEPDPPLDPQGRSLTLELSKAQIGLVAADLTDSDSADLLTQALKQLAGACSQPWTEIPSRADNAHEEIHTCPASAGSMLVLGRFPSDLASGRWQFSLAVLGPG